MKRSSHLLCRHRLVAAFTAIAAVVGVSTSASVAAQEKPAPALLIPLSGAPASELAEFGYAEPVLVTYTEAGWAAVVFAEESSAISALLERLLVEKVDGCTPEGAVVCCDEQTETFVLNTESGWIRLGERCEPDLPPDYDLNEGPGVDLATISEGLAEQLYACCRIVDNFLDLANPDGTARMLINTLPFLEQEKTEQSLPLNMWASDLPRTSSVSFVVTAPSRSPIILAHDHPTPRVSCMSDPDFCRKKRKKGCLSSNEHWYRKIKVGGDVLWCHRAGCTC